MTIVEIIRFVAAVQQLLDIVSEMVVERANARNKEKFREGAAELRATRTSEGKIAALQKMRDAISGEDSSSGTDRSP